MGCSLGFTNCGQQNPKTLVIRQDSCNPEIHTPQMTEAGAVCTQTRSTVQWMNHLRRSATGYATGSNVRARVPGTNGLVVVPIREADDSALCSLMSSGCSSLLCSPET